MVAAKAKIPARTVPDHVVVDGSNLATEGRSAPSLKQLNDAVLAFMKEYPKTQITVVVDASFGHRIDKKEAAEFSEAIANGELVTPPAGAVGRGDGFVLMIADKVNATVLSNDSYQEFHDQYTWLFDMGRLLGGKPVPHVGWVFVDRLPVRAKTDSVARRGVPNKTAPIPRPTRPPQRAVPKPDTAPKPEVAPSAVNSAEQYDAFAAKQPVGAKVKGTVESFASHGVYVRIGDVAGYLPLRLMKSPPPRTPREHVKIGESLVLTVSGFNPARRSIEVSLLPVEKLATKAPRGAKTARPARQPRPGGDGSRQPRPGGDSSRQAKSRSLRRRRRPD
ncbi:MAG: S1 RNA-binding domain-containing protein [Acidimicrobiia bacterium]|nr:S1 RNA-binding domain-containing protein [Acidimicrobiia bacterium]